MNIPTLTRYKENYFYFPIKDVINIETGKFISQRKECQV